MEKWRHHVVLGIVAAGFLGATVAVVVALRPSRGDPAGVVQSYLGLLALATAVLPAVVQWWWRQHQAHRTPRADPRTPRADTSRSGRAWLREARHQGGAAVAVVLAVAVGLAVDAAMKILGSGSPQAALTALVTTPLAYLAYVLVMTATAAPADGDAPDAGPPTAAVTPTVVTPESVGPR